jgi:hypothetical protein
MARVAACKEAILQARRQKNHYRAELMERADRPATHAEASAAPAAPAAALRPGSRSSMLPRLGARSRLNGERVATAIVRIRVLRFHDDIGSTCRG